MPSNTVTKHILTTCIHVYVVSSITRFRRQSVIWIPCAEIHWHKLKLRKKFIDRLIQVATCESPESPLQLNKTWFCGPLFKKIKPYLSLWHAHRNSSFSKDGFSATCWSSSNLTEKAAIFDLAIFAGRARRVSLSDVTAHGRESRNDRAENAWVLGCIRRWAREVGGGVGGDTGGTSEGFCGKIAIKLVAKNSILLFMCRGRSLMKDLYVYGDE